MMESFFSAPGQICHPFFVRYFFWQEYEGRSALQVEGISALTNKSDGKQISLPTYHTVNNDGHIFNNDGPKWRQ